MPVTQSIDVFFDPRLNKRLSKQWFDTPLCSIWRHSNVWLCYLIGDEWRCNTYIYGSTFSRVMACCLTALVPEAMMSQFTDYAPPGGRFKNPFELLNIRALKFSVVNKIHIFQCMGKIFCVEFQRVPLKFHTKYLTHTLKDMIFIQHWNFKSS